jgi:hypothetical protein
MTHESYKAWIDEMPIDDVRRRIERLERKLSDLHVLERLYEDQHGDGTPEPAEPQGQGGEQGAAPAEGWSQGEPAPQQG